jgi:hypothetical protein
MEKVLILSAIGERTHWTPLEHNSTEGKKGVCEPSLKTFVKGYTRKQHRGPSHLIGNAKMVVKRLKSVCKVP